MDWDVVQDVMDGCQAATVSTSSSSPPYSTRSFASHLVRIQTVFHDLLAWQSSRTVVLILFTQRSTSDFCEHITTRLNFHLFRIYFFCCRNTVTKSMN